MHPFVEDVADGQVPIVIHVIDEVVDVRRLVGGSFHDFHLAVEERRLGAGEFIPHADGEVDGTNVVVLCASGIWVPAIGLHLNNLLQPLGRAIKLSGRCRGW